MSKSNYFSQALSNFINDFANGGAIRHLADQGYTVTQIMEQLDFPASKSTVAAMVWKHYVDTGKISLEKPAQNGEIQKFSYVKEQGAYGRISMRQVVETVPVPGKEYLLCDYGKRLYQNKELFLHQLEPLSTEDREYVADLPWPLFPVYHEADERMKRIHSILSKS